MRKNLVKYQKYSERKSVKVRVREVIAVIYEDLIMLRQQSII